MACNPQASGYATGAATPEPGSPVVAKGVCNPACADSGDCCHFSMPELECSGCNVTATSCNPSAKCYSNKAERRAAWRAERAERRSLWRAGRDKRGRGGGRRRGGGRGKAGGESGEGGTTGADAVAASENPYTVAAMDAENHVSTARVATGSEKINGGTPFEAVFKEHLARRADEVLID